MFEVIYNAVVGWIIYWVVSLELLIEDLKNNQDKNDFR